MCGIAGYIGKSKDNNLSFELLSKIFEQNESRGIDASGFWGFNYSEKKVFTHKEPVRSGIFIKDKPWNDLSSVDFDILVTHSRGASKGCGDPSDNINNHPFVSKNNAIALIHNGRIEPHEYESLKAKYKLETECDSEVLLRIFECETDDSVPYQDARINALHDIFSFINHGHMAVAIAEIANNNSNLWLFRNKHRPLWIVDLRESLGQIFFFSDPDLWIDSLEAMSSEKKKFLGKQIFTQIDADQIYHIELSEFKGLTIDKFNVTRTSQYEPWSYNGDLVDKVYDLNNKLVLEKTTKENDSATEDNHFYIKELSETCKYIENTSKNIIKTIESNEDLSNFEIKEISEALKVHLNGLQIIEAILNT